MLTQTPAALLHDPRLDPAAGRLIAGRLAKDVVLLAWHAARAENLRPRLSHAGLPRPYAASVLDEATGLRAALLRLPRGARADAVLALHPSAPGMKLSAITADTSEIVATLPETARAKLLGFLLEVGGGLFGLHATPDFIAACRHLAASLAAPPAHPVAALSGSAILVAVPGAPADGAWHVLGREGAHRVAAAGAADTTLVLTDRKAAGALLFHNGPAPGLWRLATATPALPHLLAFLEATPAARGAATALVRTANAPTLAPLLREVAHLSPRPPRRHDGAQLPVAAALELALPDHAGGLFLRGYMRDPHGLVAGLALAGTQADTPIAAGAVFRLPRPDLARRFARAAHAGDPAEGFVVHLPTVQDDAVNLAQPELKLLLHSGAAISLVPPLRSLPPAAARDAVLGSVAPEAVGPAMLAACLAPAAQRLHQAALAVPRVTELVRIGTQPARPTVSVLVPLYRNLAFLRAQIAAFACDPFWREVETILVLDSPEQRAEVEHLLRGLYIMHGVPITLVVMPRNLGYAAANNAGAAIARGKFLLLLNSDVVPDAPGWLAALGAPLDTDRKLGATGPKLLFEDGSLQHAGLHFDRDADGTWFNRHYYKGFPRHFAPACQARAVPGVTGAALLVRKSLFDKAGGLTEDYIIGDYEDSDFCLKLRDLGAGIAYVPQAELWHFERRSIRLHAGYARTLASTYNKRLHHARWDSAIAALMPRFAPGAAA